MKMSSRTSTLRLDFPVVGVYAEMCEERVSSSTLLERLCGPFASCHREGTLQTRGQDMTELQGRGYLIGHTASFLRDKVSKEDWKRIQGELSPVLQQLVAGQVKQA